MTFREVGNGREVIVRRRLLNKKSSKPDIEETGFDELGLAPVAFEVGTVMPGLLSHIRIGAASDLGKAIAELTGLAPLRLMVKHARKAKERIEKDLIEGELADAIDGADERFIKARNQLAILLKEHPDITAADAASVFPAVGNAETRLAAITADIRQWQGNAYADARTVLGDAFDPQDSAARRDLDVVVGNAMTALAPGTIVSLDSAAALNRLGKLTSDDLSGCEATLAAFRAEAQELRALAADPALESRMRLYVRVANWLRDCRNETPPDTCPVCLQPFGDQRDPVTGRPTHEHLQETLKDGKAFLEKTLAAWAQGALGTLARDLPEALSKAMSMDLPATPAALLRTALTEELFGADCFSGVLAPLRAHAEVLCDIHLAALPAFTEPMADDSLVVEPAFARLQTVLHRLDRAIAFARWRNTAGAECTAAFYAIIGKKQDPKTAASLHEQPLYRQVEALQEIVRAAIPSATALGHLAAMQRELTLRRGKEAGIAQARKAAEHLAELFPIGDLVQQQLEALRWRLDGDTSIWMGRLYRAATAGTAPTPRRSAVDPTGKLDVVVERGGTLVSAEHIGELA